MTSNYVASLNYQEKMAYNFWLFYDSKTGSRVHVKIETLHYSTWYVINLQRMHKGYSNRFFRLSVCLSHLDLGASALTTVQTATSTQQLKSY